MTSRGATSRSLTKFAREAGVSIFRCGPGWGGRIAYREKDHPRSAVCGFRSAHEAYMHWLVGTFGQTTADALLSLLARKI